ncbi:MAG: hypothetical protein KAR06_01915, partial [Deltaproteobacteria bacterium]|nr:hypothetical protein [Deltaproteobacteria bacterium]
FIEDFYSMMDSSLGIMTYDDAVTRWGVPLRKTETEESFTAVWVSEVPDKLLGYKEEANSSVIKRVKIVEDVPRGEELTLGFNKDTMKLKNWNYEGW